uniref:BPTI/Kunitz inhibitor domain-containing protein n=1 Tax=Meloidogyne hapla TaxID=6305 RepID=A0A1I8C253_MELHA
MFVIFIILLNLIPLIIKYFTLANETFLQPIEIKPDIHPQQVTSFMNKIAVCKLPLEYGNCKRKLTRFYWDKKSGKCLKFYYTGCGGNRNRFSSRRKCRKRCSHKQHKHRKTKIIAKLSIQNREKINNGKIFKQLLECKPGYAGSGLNCTNDQKPNSEPNSSSNFLEICSQSFDRRYERQCLTNGYENNWQARWYYHLNSGRCRLFWHGGCQLANAQNFFLDQQYHQHPHRKQQNLNKPNGVIQISLEKKKKNKPTKIKIIKEDKCLKQTNHKIREHLNKNKLKIKEKINEENYLKKNACFEIFDLNLTKNCGKFPWKVKFFFDQRYNVCRPFWYNGCDIRQNSNYFESEQICKEICEKERENKTNKGYF